jgi:uncharacterized protein involved in exopolysaccharide biosynthesis
MNALAQLAEESPNMKALNAEALQVLNDHTGELARLKQACLMLQLQVSQLTQQMQVLAQQSHCQTVQSDE